ncbi:MAG: CPBP family intramembrane metalloprotease [Phycisphaeraceae bacterium]|nr:CPBP family intramembrane metalloprotease [Phycisphaeraceae bacterium]
MARPIVATTATAYFDRSKQPLEILAFLAPLIVIFEIGLVGVLRHGDGSVLTNRAHLTLLRLFEWSGVRAEALLLPALSLPAAALIVVLLTWHALSRRSWSVHLPTVGGMAIESLLTALPLVTIGWIVASLPLAAAPDPRTLGVPAQIAVALGAGLYEELLFRLALLSLLHSVFRRIPKCTPAVATVLAVTISALCFTFYHPVIEDGRLALRTAIILFLAGLWWGTLFVIRGFGIAVGSHAAYDAIVLLLPGWLGTN